jgi:hypothetical protein
MLQSRGVAFDDEPKLHAQATEVYINIAYTTGIKYCPWCAQPLSELIRRSPDTFNRLAEEHSKYLDDIPISSSG